MPETCHVTGTVVSPDHLPLSNALIEFQLIPQLVQPSRNGSDTLAPKSIEARADNAGAIDLRLEPAVYQVTITSKTGHRYQPYRVAVPDEDAANLADIQAAPPPEPVYMDEIRDALSEVNRNAAAAVQAAAQAAAVLEQFPDGIPGDKGPPGPSAYDDAVAAGFVGTVEEWLASLEGEDGGPGASAYEEAVAEGFEGTRAEWLASLVGERGPVGPSYNFRGDSSEIIGQTLSALDTFGHGTLVAGMAVRMLLKPRAEIVVTIETLADLTAIAANYNVMLSAFDGMPGAPGNDGQSMTITTTTTQAAFDAAVATPTSLVVRIF